MIVPNLKPYWIIASRKLLNLFNTLSPEYVLVPFPKEGEKLLLSYITNEITYEELLNSMISIDPLYTILSKQYVNMWPLVNVIKRVYQKMAFKVLCYNSLSSIRTELMSFMDLISLVMITRISNRLKFDKLLRILSHHIDNYKNKLKGLVKEFMKKFFIFEGSWLMISDFSGRHLALELKGLGIKRVRLIYITPYIFTPLERLIREYAHGSLSEELARELIRAHADFLWNYVLLSNDINEAYLKWLREKHNREYLALVSRLYSQYV